MPKARIGLVEYGGSKPIQDMLGLGLTQGQLIHKFVTSGEELQRKLKLRQNPFEFGARHLSVGGIAGLLKIAPELEVEIAPKFLGLDWTSWREDFFFALMLSRHGRLLPNQKISTATGSSSDLASLIGQAIVSMYGDSQRRPLKTYRWIDAEDYSLDGEVDVEEILLPSENGFSQRQLVYNRTNKFNSTILEAVQTILPLVRDEQTRRQLLRVSSFLKPQEPMQKAHSRRLPQRAARWQSLYDLSVDVLNGFGLNYRSSKMIAPGFVVDTWRVWEDLVTLAVRSEMSALQVAPQETIGLGQRKTFSDGQVRIGSVSVVPDIRVGVGNKAIIDAKYKGKFAGPAVRIVEADLYESLAFSRASGANKVILLYPAVPKNQIPPITGSFNKFEEILVQGTKVIGIEMEVRGLAAVGGFSKFKEGVRLAIEAAEPGTTIN